MRLSLLLCSAFIVVPTTAHAQPVEASLAEARATPVLTLQISEQVTRLPDVVRFQVGVSEEADTARAALNGASERLDRLVAALEAIDVERDDITVSNISLGQRYDYNGRTPTFLGYTGSASVSFETGMDVEVAPLLDRLGELEISQISGPQFDLANRLPLRAEARRRALERADAEAAQYARLRGYRTARMVSMSEGYSYNSSPIVVTGSRISAPGAPPPPPPPPMAERGGGNALLGAEIGEQVTIQVAYTLEN
ncbi:SIMPL domain-containing protein [Sphingomicrobium sp. XHP0235]|uniref:SIMPL domain-containing protein n=1 Tax=Sphingomicrobium aquimarinum TaxID=3133971 RepID=UPI0031FF10B1